MPLFPFVFLVLIVGGVFLTVRWAVGLRVRPSADLAQPITGYVSNISVLRSEYVHYYGREIEEARIENQFRRAAGLTTERNYPGAASMLEMVSHGAALPVVYADLGIVYSQLGDTARAVDAFREALARDLNYAPARQFLHTTRSITPSAADPYIRELEPNNEASTANLVGLGTAVSAEIQGGGGDIDYFRVISPAAPRDLIAVEVANHSIQFVPQVRIYDANLRVLGWAKRRGRRATPSAWSAVRCPIRHSTFRCRLTRPKAASMFFQVKPQHAFDSFEPNDDIMTSHQIALGQEVHANIMDADDTDFYSFQSPRKGTSPSKFSTTRTPSFPPLPRSTTTGTTLVSVRNCASRVWDCNRP